MGRTLQEIADAKGYGSPAGAYNAIQKHIQRMPPEEQATARAYSAGGYKLVVAQLWEIFAQAKRSQEHSAAVAAARAIADIQDKHDRLLGIVPAAAAEVTVRVQSAVAVIDRAEEELLAIAAARRAADPAVIDAEVVEV
jgi:putative SOS response-associated peptidase YedK